ncbi:MAG: PEP/pyruvate-binding domain-containing protein [bacterium]
MYEKGFPLLSTGLSELDNVIQGVHPGDNIVWQVDSIDDYILFVHPFCRNANKKGIPLIYFRFADHRSLLPEEVKADVYTLHPEDGFETFIAEIFKVIEEKGTGAFYVFDCLSELTVDWYSDRMLGNFFMLTCPYLYDYDTAAYFALLRNRHITWTVNAIHNTSQVVIDVYKNKDNLYLQPLKVYKRHTSTMYMLHHWKDNAFIPETRSAIISEILEEVSHPWLDFAVSKQDMLPKVLERAREIQQEVSHGGNHDSESEKYFNRLLRMVVTREEQVLELAKKYLNLSDLIDIGKHIIGTGLIGGKTIGMLIARAIIKKAGHYWEERLEAHDSFFVGSDVFYTYLIKSGCWWMRWKQRKGDNYLEGIEEARLRMLNGKFPDDIQDEFKDLLNYFGQSPIIVRSSSLLEDAYGNSFSGKYESVFCANQGTPEERMKEFMNAVRTVYASTMSPEALLYRAQRGLLDRDEQMALLIQRVSGSIYNKLFYPQIAGVGLSYNPYAWSKVIDPKAGVLRLVFGLGTRAVNRSDDDYTRIVALNDPKRKPVASVAEAVKYTQKKADILDLEANKHISKKFADVVGNSGDMQLNLFASHESETEYKNVFPWILTFENLFTKTQFAQDMRIMLAIIQEAYKYPVDIEFTGNFFDNENYKINLLQCRPFQVKRGAHTAIKEPGKIEGQNLIVKTSGPIIGNSMQTVVDRLIYVVPAHYGKLPDRDRYSVARLIGKLTNLPISEHRVIMLIGPGRWGTTTPSLGVPVTFGEINHVSVICELAEMHEGLMPDVSLGTHFFNDLVELDILYLAVYPSRTGYIINKDFLDKAPNQLNSLIPGYAKWEPMVRVIDFDKNKSNQQFVLNVDTTEQRCVCYLKDGI